MSASPQPEPVELTLFGVASPAPLKRIAPVSDKPRWARLTGRRLKCDDCIEVLVRDSTGPVPRRAVSVRTRNGHDRRLCYEHAAHWKETDERADRIEAERYDLKGLEAEQWPMWSGTVARPGSAS